jgi:dihydroorotate dehydrogenase (NAD+) catalytic subunit
VRENTSKPVLAKLSPAITDLNEAIEVLNPLVDGYVAINSLGPALDFNIETMEPVLGSEDARGWLSGRAILPIGLHFVASISSLTDKPVIGVGGIRTVTDVIKYLMAGASAVQISSAAILQGEKIYGKLVRELDQWMTAHAYHHVAELTGAFTKKKRGKLYYLGEGPQLYPQISDESCKYCDLCVKACMYHAIRFADEKFFLDRESCVSCGLCTTVCIYNALRMAED